LVEDKMRQVISAIKQHLEESNRKLVLDFIMEHPDRSPSFEKALEADVLYALTHVDEDTTIKRNKKNNYDFLLPNLDMKIEFKATRHGGKNQLNEIRFGRKGKRIADYYLLIAPKNPFTIYFLKECQDMNYKMVVDEIYGKNQYVLALIESPPMSS
jgi:hypothetical protein